MKSKISKILGVAVTVALIASLFAVALPASAHVIFKAQWWAESEPDSTTSYKNLVVRDLVINDVAANGDIVYVAADNSSCYTGTLSFIQKGYALYKSTDGGATFSSLETTTFFPQGITINKVAISKENPDVVAFIGSNNYVYYSTTGGAVWTSLGLPADTSPASTAAVLNDIDIYGGATTYVAVGGNNTLGNPELFTYRVAILESWQARYTSASGIAGGQDEIKAVMISPGFGSEKAILAVSGNSTSACFQIFRYQLGDMDWNGEIGYLDSTYWGTGVAISGLYYTTVAGGVAEADIAVPADYLANDDDMRLAYVSVAGGTSGGGVVSLSDVTVTGFRPWSGSLGQISSVAYNENGTLIAGDYDENKVYQFLSPTGPLPKASKTNTLKQPGGSSDTIVAYAGDNILAGTAGDEGGLAMSTDDGYSFNDVALINTTITGIPDFDVAADGSKTYLVTDSAGDIAVWMKAGPARYKRVMSLKDQTNTTLLVRMAPDDSSAVYVGQLGTQNMWMSANSGTESWKSRDLFALTGGTIVDFAVESADVVYAVDDDSCTKTTDAGLNWGLARKPAEGMAPYMITVASNGDVLIGGAGTAYWYYSKDGGATFSRAGSLISSGNSVVVPDDGYADNGVVYIGIGTSVKRGSLSGIPASTRGATTGYTITGIGQAEGVLYVIGCNGTESVLYQSLNIEKAADATPPYTDADWSQDDAVTSDYNAGRNSMKVSVSGGMPTLWAIDTSSTDDLESFTDPVSLSAPAITGPDDGAEISVNPKSGQAYDVTYTFNKYNDTDVADARIQIATDPDFNARLIDSVNINPLTTVTQAWLVGPNGGTNMVVNYLPGETYYWRVRTTSPLNSPWTATRSFTVASLEEPFDISGPAVGAGDVSVTPTLTWAEYEGAIKYEIAVSEFPTFDILEWSANADNPFYAVSADSALKYSTTYYWRVRAILTEPVLVGRGYQYESGPWVTGVFTTMAEPVVEEEPEPVVITEPGETRVEVIKVPVTTSPVIPTYLLWVIVGVGAVLIIALIVLIVRTRRVA